MRKLAHHVAATVDRDIADADHAVGAFAQEGDHVTDFVAAMKAHDTIVMGRGT